MCVADFLFPEVAPVMDTAAAAAAACQPRCTTDLSRKVFCPCTEYQAA